MVATGQLRRYGVSVCLRIAPSLNELRSLVRLMLIDHLKVQESLALQAMTSDPEAGQRYRDLQARRKALVAASSVGIIQG